MSEVVLLREQLRGVEAIRDEVMSHGSAADIEELKYVLYEPAAELVTAHGVRDQGRSGERLIDFATHTAARAAELSLAHVLALRLYTTPAFSLLNAPLRELQCAEDGSVLNPPRIREPHRLPTTVTFLSEAIKKLRAPEADRREAYQALTLYRGLRNVSAGEAFLLFGGTELAPMSTTTDLHVALSYSTSTSAFIFQVLCMMIAWRIAIVESSRATRETATTHIHDELIDFRDVK